VCKWLLQNTDIMCVNDYYTTQIKMCLHHYYTNNNNTAKPVQREPGLLYKPNLK